ncbi:MAG TPA: hypothetical protein VG271_08925, partial [Beijerinckiaceae bacterium]|nr:hypothetical protein [Beijerinckiaceae bacterium]
YRTARLAAHARRVRAALWPPKAGRPLADESFLVGLEKLAGRQLRPANAGRSRRKARRQD